MSRGTVGVLVICFLAAGCGARQRVDNRAQVYDLSYGQVWAAVRTEVQARYQHIAIEAPTTGLILTEWAWYDAYGARRPDYADEGDALLRVVVNVFDTGDGWSVAVDAESQIIDRETGKARFAGTEPGWVRAEVDAVSDAIHRRLDRSAAL